VSKKQPDYKRSILYVLVKKYGIRGVLRIVKKDIWFDVKHRTNTAAPVNQKRLFPNEYHAEQNRYVASTFDVLESVMAFAYSKVNLAECGFVDLGSGKGKALIVATRYPFKRIKGMEISAKMHKAAVRNLRLLGISSRVELINDSATNVEFLPDERVIYFFNSFTGYTLDRCLQNIMCSRRVEPGIFIYVNPTEHEYVQQYFSLLKKEFITQGNCEVNYYSIPAGNPTK